MKSSVLVRELKQQLIDGGSVGFENIYLIPSGLTGDFPLEDDSLPLHLCSMVDDTTIRIIGGRVHIQLVSQFGHLWWKSFPRNITANQMKKRLVGKLSSAEEKDLVDDVWLFVQRGDSYRKLDEEAIIGSILSDNDVIYLVEDRFFQDSDVLPVYYRGEEVGRVGWKIYISPQCYRIKYTCTVRCLSYVFLMINDYDSFPRYLDSSP